MNYLLMNIALALAWAALTARFEPGNLLVGFVLGYVALWVTRPALGPTPYFGAVRRTLSFVALFVWEVIVANLRVAVDVLTPRYRMQPRVIAVPLDARSDAEITLLANLISLTPGSLSLDVSSDRRTLYVHAMYAADADAVRREIKVGLERRLLAVLRGTSPTVTEESS